MQRENNQAFANCTNFIWDINWSKPVLISWQTVSSHRTSLELSIFWALVLMYSHLSLLSCCFIFNSVSARERAFDKTAWTRRFLRFWSLQFVFLNFTLLIQSHKEFTVVSLEPTEQPIGWFFRKFFKISSYQRLWNESYW